MSNKILCVDDDANLLTGIQRNLRKNFDIDTAVGALAALKMIEKDCPYAVIVSDMQMPGMSGVEFLKITRQKYPDTVRVMLTGNADQKTASDAVNKGQVFQFVNKPCTPDKLAEVITAGIKHHHLITAEKELLENTLNGSVRLLMEVLSVSDPASSGRSQTLRDQCRQVAQVIELKSTWELDLAVMLYRIGFVSLPPELNQKLRNGTSLTQAENDVLLRVPQIGSDLLNHIPRLQSVARIVLYQNKNFDGTGFPDDAIKGEDIPLEARIIRALVDLAQTEANGASKSESLERMRRQTGFYDPRVLEAVAKCFDPAFQPAAPPAKPAITLSFKELRPGHILASDISTIQDILIVPAGTTITPLILARLRNFDDLSGLKEPILVQS